jgi:L-ascorbate metabolism protein UlaG (beta-lactamase superfamily)
MADMAAIEKVLSSMHWLGHDTFRLDCAEGAVYFDPYEISGSPEPAALILATHEHYDHCVAGDIKKLQGPDTVIITESDCAAKLDGPVKTVKPGQSLEVGGITIQAIPAYNTNKQFHPKANGWLGFVVTVDGVSIYHAGDTDHIPEMAGLEPDIALLPVSGTYVMTAAEAVEAAKAIQPKVAAPMHYGAIVGDAGDAKAFAAALEGQIKVHIFSKEG